MPYGFTEWFPGHQIPDSDGPVFAVIAERDGDRTAIEHRGGERHDAIGVPDTWSADRTPVGGVEHPDRVVLPARHDDVPPVDRGGRDDADRAVFTDTPDAPPSPPGG